MKKNNAKTPKSGMVLWISVTLAFIVLIGAWVSLITIASKNAPEPVPLVDDESRD